MCHVVVRPKERLAGTSPASQAFFRYGTHYGIVECNFIRNEMKRNNIYLKPDYEVAFLNVIQKGTLMHHFCLRKIPAILLNEINTSLNTLFSRQLRYHQNTKCQIMLLAMHLRNRFWKAHLVCQYSIKMHH